MSGYCLSESRRQKPEDRGQNSYRLRRLKLLIVPAQSSVFILCGAVKAWSFIRKSNTAGFIANYLIFMFFYAVKAWKFIFPGCRLLPWGKFLPVVESASVNRHNFI